MQTSRASDSPFYLRNYMYIKTLYTLNAHDTNTCTVIGIDHQVSGVCVRVCVCMCV